ncbi:hypothetical protein M3Y97_00630400 [Aphelenchoides bicaudatus]|nr:hypothetical protein M3Y97_00630400 [Aphelenchoides bicaudatus]
MPSKQIIWMCFWIICIGERSASAKLPSGIFERRCSNSSICLNGGECVLSSTRLNSAKCSSTNSHFSDADQTCLTVVHSTKSFDAAQKECQQTNGHLLWLANGQKLKWLRSKFANKSAGIWTGGKEINGVLKWEPNGTRIHLKDFNLNELNDFSSERCLVVENGQYKLESCDQSHLFVCEAPMDTFDSNNEWYAQCRCQRGYAGRYCQFYKSENEAFDRMRCANESLNGFCTEGTLMVDYASYGRSDSCKNSNTPTAECFDSSSLVILINKCQGRKSCKVDRISDLFGDCPTDGMGLLHKFRCSQEPETKCPNNTVFANERCYEFSNSTIKKSYTNAWLHCARKGGLLAHYNESVNFGQMLGQLKPSPDSEFWIHNNTKAKLPLIGPRRPTECLAVAWWNAEFLSQLPCYAKLGFYL